MRSPPVVNESQLGGFLSPEPRALLQAWQERLVEHFTRLAASRREADWPVFALEHGLSVSDRDALMRTVRECAVAGIDRDVLLPWIVYAAEIGYEYSGYEYWQTFALKTPGLDKRHFTRISILFDAFAETYHGARPDGRWALWFRHIAWPITHGILPRDLQRQLAELLYDASLTFRAETFSSAEALGHHLRERGNSHSSRFRQFAENETLLGQIALALLLQDAANTFGGLEATIISSDTLARIVADLNRERDTRQWLADARSAARIRVRGLSRISLRARNSDSSLEHDATAGSPHSGAELPRPRFLLREEALDRWQVRVQLPNLTLFAAGSPRVREVLVRTQGRVAGAVVPILASGRIVRDANIMVTLSTWPEPQTQLLTFNNSPPELDAALSTIFRVPAGDRWLFSIESDGQARQLAPRVLRAGASYLLLQKNETRNPAFGLRVVEVTCGGIYALRIDVPSQVPDALVDVLAILGLEVAKTLEVWPAGLPVAEWNDQGHAVLVTGQPVILAVRTDHQLERLTLSIDGVRHPDVHIAPDALPGAPVFLQFPALRPGPHHITIAARTTTDFASADVPASGKVFGLSELSGGLSCVVREPRTAATGQAGALSFAVTPLVPSLEEVWEDRMEVHVAAPGATSVRCCIVLWGLQRQMIFRGQFALPSPCTTDAWRRAFAPVRKSVEGKYDEAQSCVLDFDAGVLGRGRVTAERDFTSLRWAVRENGHRVVLIDSQGCAELTYFTLRCAAPSLELRGDAAAAMEGITIGDGGALVVARSERLEAATVVVPSQRMGSLAALSGERPQVPVPTRESSALCALARTAALWERARLAGSSLAELRRAAAVEALIASIMGAVAGGRWTNAEDVLRDRGPQAAADLMRSLISSRPDERALGVVLNERLAATAQTPMLEAESVLLGALKAFVRVQNLDALAPYALRLAASPAQARALLEGWTDTDGRPKVGERELIDCLLAYPVVLRAARYFVVATRAVVLTHGLEHALPWEN
jgi:hypothetical protein